MKEPILVVIGALLLGAFGCHDDTQSPTEPVTARVPSNVVTTATLALRQLSAGQNHTCGVTTDDRAYCWGTNESGALGIGTSGGPQPCGDAPCSLRPVAVLGGLRFRNVSAGADYTCGVTTDNRAYCWGDNTGGQLGDGTRTDRYRPVAVRGGHLFRQLSTGDNHTCGVTTDDRAYCWGFNDVGQLGDGTRLSRLTPVAVAGARQYRLVSAAREHTCGLATDNRAFCWGQNGSGALGDSTLVQQRLVPVRVVGGRYYRQLAAGVGYTCAVTTGNRAFCWGVNGAGQLGDGTFTNRRWPVAVVGGLSFDRVTLGFEHTCGETTGSPTYCWGLNIDGQLGDATHTGMLCPGGLVGCRPRPVLVVGGLSFAQVDTGNEHTCARTAANVAYCWGSNSMGKLGNGLLGGRRVSPTRVLDPL